MCLVPQKEPMRDSAVIIGVRRQGDSVVDCPSYTQPHLVSVMYTHTQCFSELHPVISLLQMTESISEDHVAAVR